MEIHAKGITPFVEALDKGQQDKRVRDYLLTLPALPEGKGGVRGAEPNVEIVFGLY
jgi:hypothetical protein